MSRTRVTALLFAGLMIAGGFGVAQADPGPNDHNNHGLCTAYFNGQKNGHEHSRPGPFTALETAAENADQSVYEYCSAHDIGGNPGENGRFTECFDGDDQTGNDACPSE